MTDGLIAEEITNFVLQLFHRDGRIEEWSTLTPIELGVLSWHLGNFCGDSLIGVLGFAGYSCREGDFPESARPKHPAASVTRLAWLSPIGD